MSDLYYSKKNPHGPYGLRNRPGEKTKPLHIEGQSSRKNLAEWAEYASRASRHIGPGVSGPKAKRGR